MSLERMRRPLLIGVPVVVLLGLAVLWLLGGRTQSTDDAYVRAAQVTVSAWPMRTVRRTNLTTRSGSTTGRTGW